MALSIREQVINALLGRIEALRDELQVTVEHNREADPPADSTPWLVLRDGDESPPDETVGFGSALYTLQQQVEITISAPEQGELGTVMNNLLGRLRRQLLADRTLAGLAQDLRLGALVMDEVAAGEATPSARATQTIEIDYWTADNDPFTRGPMA